jgi:hypothetical protein
MSALRRTGAFVTNMRTSLTARRPSPKGSVASCLKRNFPAYQYPEYAIHQGQAPGTRARAQATTTARPTKKEAAPVPHVNGQMCDAAGAQKKLLREIAAADHARGHVWRPPGSRWRVLSLRRRPPAAMRASLPLRRRPGPAPGIRRGLRPRRSLRGHGALLRRALHGPRKRCPRDQRLARTPSSTRPPSASPIPCPAGHLRPSGENGLMMS